MARISVCFQLAIAGIKAKDSEKTKNQNSEQFDSSDQCWDASSNLFIRIGSDTVFS